MAIQGPRFQISVLQEQQQGKQVLSLQNMLWGPELNFYVDPGLKGICGTYFVLYDMHIIYVKMLVIAI